MKSQQSESIHGPQALSGSDLLNLIGLIAAHGVDRAYMLRLPALFFWSALLAPLYLIEKVLTKVRREVAVHPEPVFIIGHWRSGTTYLHYLLAKDKQFGFCSNLDAFVPGSVLLTRKFLRWAIRWRLPKTRPCDGLTLSPDDPQEDEFAMMLLTPFSPYHSFVFPRTASLIPHLETLADDSKDEGWPGRYLLFVQELTWKNNGKRLLLKNPANTCRIAKLLEIFPGAKFIYMYRNPQEVKASTHRMLKAMLEINALQAFDGVVSKKNIECVYSQTISGYEKQRNLLNNTNLVEIDYKNLVRTPLQTIKNIYQALNIAGFEESKTAFSEFIAQQADHKPAAN
jgi:hypothetical protein